MELFKDIWLEQGWITWAQEIWLGNYGEYPPMFAGILGLWWGFISLCLGVTPPESMWIRGILPISVFVMAGACGRIAWRYKQDWFLVATWVACIPLLNGVGRHFMLEPWMSMWVCLSIMSTVEAIHSDSPRNWLLAGVLAGCALMTKQTAVLFLFPIWMGLFWAHRTKHTQSVRSWFALLIALLVLTIPWYGSHLSSQWNYLSASAAGKVVSMSWMQLIFYPTRMLFDLPNIFALLLLLWYRRKIPHWLWGWLLSLILLMLIPKQYPRLMITWLPVLGFLLGSIKLSQKTTLLTVSVAFLGLWTQSFHSIQRTLQTEFANIQHQIDDGCPQDWLRAPSTNDGYLSEIAQKVQQTHSNQLIIEGDPTIPCHIQSTHNWRDHVDPYLRRRGLEVHIIDSSPNNNSFSQWQQDSIQIRWKGSTIESNVQIRHIPSSNSRPTQSTP